MGLISETVKVIPRGNTISYYKEKGYDAKYGQELEVKVKDLSLCSTALVETECDYCGKKRQPIKYVDYNAQTKNGTEKCCCVDCAKFKREESMLKKYGNKNPMAVPELIKKRNETNLQKYGSVSPSSSPEVRAKQKETLMRNYGVENPSLSKEIQDKRKQTFIERFGVDNPLKNPEVKNKITQTIFERYGVDNVSKNKDIQHKREQTFMERYGVIAPLQNEECFKKLKQTNIERYGHEFSIQLEEIKEKRKQTCLERFGVENPLLNDKIKERIRNTNLKKYGVECLLSLPSFHEHSRKVDMERYGVYHHLQNPEILAKQKDTFYKNNTCPTSKQQRYLNKLYGGKLNYPLMMYNLDIFLPDEKINIEFDGSGHLMSVKCGSVTQDEFDRKEIIRNTTIKKAGIKQIRIKSNTDKLPSDQTLLQMLQEAKEYFSKTDHSWCCYDIDQSLLFNAEHKSGIYYSYGALRTIKEIDLNTDYTAQEHLTQAV